MSDSPARGMWRLTFALAASSAALALWAAAGHSLAARLAIGFADDGALSPEFVQRLVRAQWALGVAGLIAAAAIPWSGAIATAARRIVAQGSDRRFLVLLFVAATAGAWLIQERLFDGLAHVTDAVSHLHEARILALGRISVPHPPCPDAFAHEHIAMTFDGRWFTKYTPGHPLVLALGVVTGLLPFVVPSASGLAAVFFVLALKPLLGRVSARLCGLLFLVSPLVLLLGGSFMSHTTYLACVLGGTVGLQRVVSGPARGEWSCRALRAGTGLLWGWALITRPQDAALAGVLALLALCLSGTLRRAVTALPWMLCGLAIPALILLAWNRALYGTPLAIGYGFTSVGFRMPMYQATFGLSDAFPLSKAIAITSWTWFRLNGALLGWPLSLIFVPLALAARSAGRLVLFCFAACAVFVGVYFFYSYYGAEYEARYYFPLVPPLLTLTVLGLRRLAATRVGTAWAIWLLLASFVYAGGHYWPVYLIPRYAQAYEQVSPHVAQAAREAQLGKALVLMPIDPNAPYQYPAGFQFNDPWLRSDLLFARDLPEAYDCLRSAFADRAIYRAVYSNAQIRFVPLP